MKLIPTLFSTPMVNAVNFGTKDVTRRTRGLDYINKNPDCWELQGHTHENGNIKEIPFPIDKGRKDAPWFGWVNHRNGSESFIAQCPYGKPGDVLWVRETFYGKDDTLQYYAEGKNKRPFDLSDNQCIHLYGDKKNGWPKWKPSIHMPYSACRTWLEVVSVRPERLRDITDEDAVREGAMTLGLYPGYNMRPKEHFFGLWVNINGPESVESNPWVWRIEFKPTSKPEVNP